MASDEDVGGGIQVQTGGDVGPSIQFGAEKKDTDRAEVYLDGTLVLIGCGKAKRDPNDPVDLHQAEISEGQEWGGREGPLWQAKDLYTSTYFSSKRDFAERISRGLPTEASGWAILSAEHGVVPPWEPLKPYDTTLDDLGGDPNNPDHRVDNSWVRRRPDGQEIVTEIDEWSAKVATTLAKWVASHREATAGSNNAANELLVLAGQDYINPLRERDVFENGIARMTGDPNAGFTLPVRTRYLFEEIDASGIGEQMGWLSDAVDRLDAQAPTDDRQAELGSWVGGDRECEHCGVPAADADLRSYGHEVACRDCAPDQCCVCGSWTHEKGLGTNPLCDDCTGEHGGRIYEDLEEPTEQLDVIQSIAATDGGEQDG